MRGSFFVAPGLVVLGMGCGSSASVAQVAPTAKPTVPAPAVAAAAVPSDDYAIAKVVVLDHGAEPRALRRYALRPGLPEQATLEHRTEPMDSPRGSLPMPSSRSKLSLRPDVLPDSAEGWLVQFGWLEHESAVGASGIAETGAIIGALGSAVMLPRGGFGLRSLPVGSDSKIIPMSLGVLDDLARISIVLPASPIGVGARWQVTYDKDLPAVRRDAWRDFTFRLAQLTSDGADLTFAVAIDDEQMKMPGQSFAPNASLPEMSSTRTTRVSGKIQMRWASIAARWTIDETSTSVTYAAGQKVVAKAKSTHAITPDGQ